MKVNNIKLKGVIALITDILLIILLLFLVYANIAQYFLGQLTLAVVKGMSMYPLLRENDLVIIIPPRNLQLGDIVVFKNDRNEYIIHRIIAIASCKDGGKVYITKGDNNIYIDTTISIAYRVSRKCDIDRIDVLKGHEKLIHHEIMNNTIRGIPIERIVGKVLSLLDMTVKITGVIPFKV